MKTMQSRFVYLVAALVLVASCAGLPRPQNFEERLVYGYATYTAVQNTIATLAEHQQLEYEEGERLLRISSEARGFLDAARVMRQLYGEAEGDKQLTLAIILLGELQEYLHKRAAP